MVKFSEFDMMSMMKLLHIVTSDNKHRLVENVTTLNALHHGLIFMTDTGEILEVIDKTISELAIDTLGLDNETWSGTFHKSWDKVESAPIEELVFEQLVHYASTYGLESLGFDAMPVIPREEVMSDSDILPSIKSFTIIRVVSIKTALDIIEEYVRSIKSPHKNDIQAIVSLMDKTSLTIDDLISFELKIARHDQLGTVPSDGQDFLRYAVYKMTGNTLLIKNSSMISSIQDYCERHPEQVYKMLTKCDEVELAKVFFRFKPLILAFKKSRFCRPIVNRIRRLANKYHKPLSDKNIANLTKLIAENRFRDAIDIINKADNRTLLKLINFSNSATLKNADTKIFNIRNGSSYITERKTNYRVMNTLYAFCFEILLRNCKNKLAGKTYLIPEYIEYAAPISEKQMIGQIPYGTIIHGSNSDTISPAIWWTDHDGLRTDIDIHLNSKNESFGWNCYYRDNEARVLYSGDMTEADPYASEAFRIRIDNDEAYIFTICLFGGHNNVPFKFMLTDVDFSHLDEAPINVEDALFAPIDMKFNNTRNMSLGFIQGNAFYFYGGELGKRITPDVELNNRALDAMTNRVSSMFKLEDFIELSGGKIIRSTSEIKDDEEVISLEPNAITAKVLFDIID